LKRQVRISKNILNSTSSQVKSLGSFIKRSLELRTGGTWLHLLYCETAFLFVCVWQLLCVYVFDPCFVCLCMIIVVCVCVWSMFCLQTKHGSNTYTHNNCQTQTNKQNMKQTHTHKTINTHKQTKHRTNKQTNKNESPSMEYLLVPSGQFYRLSWRRQITILIRKNNDDVCFVQTKTPSLILIVLAHRSSSP
jgi:ABC-type bacteriocin/lantibiotic exporter with double-glycine peptidase domain